MRYVVAILSLIAVLATLAGVKASQISTLMDAGKAMQKAGPPPEVVSTRVIENQTWGGTLSATGSIIAAQGVSLSADAPGIVSRLHFDSGKTVKQGQVLVELDSNVERAQLASVRARRELAATSLKRTQSLVESGALAPAQLDADESAYKSLSAEAATLEAQIQRKVIRAPFSGRIGIREVNLGQYLAPGTRVGLLEATKTVYVDFSLPQEQISNLAVGMPVNVYEARGSTALAGGTIRAIEPAVDTATRSVKIRASVANDKDQFRTGMFVKAEVVLPNERAVTVIPATALVHASYGDSVFIVEKQAATAEKPAGTYARQQFVRQGESRGDFVAILDGVKPGQEVVTSGAFKLRNGSPVVVNNSVKLEPQVEPQPVNR